MLIGAARRKHCVDPGVVPQRVAVTQVGEDVAFQVSQADMTDRRAARAAESNRDMPAPKVLPASGQFGGTLCHVPRCQGEISSSTLPPVSNAPMPHAVAPAMLTHANIRNTPAVP